MSVDIAKTYLEIQQLRKEVRKAELALRIAFARAPYRALHTGRPDARGSQVTNSQMHLLKRVRVN